MAEKPKVVITQRLPGVSPEKIGEKATTVLPTLDGPMPRKELMGKVRGAVGILCTLESRIDAALMDAAGDSLRVVSNFAVGVNNIDVPEATRRKIRVCNTPDVLTEATADAGFGLMLAAARRFSEAERFLRAGKFTAWDPWGFLGVPVFGRTLGIVGMGKIGSAIAARARGFEMRVLYHDRKRLPKAREDSLRARHVGLDDLLSASDFVVISVPLSPDTRGMIGRGHLGKMKKEAVLVNIARGGIVDEAALAEALAKGRIFATGLDVYEKEPKVHPGLLRVPSAVLLPHVGSATKEAREGMGKLATENLMAVLSGGDPPCPVN